MKNTYKTIIGLAILALLLAPLGIAMAEADGDPVVTPGYSSITDYQAKVKFQSFNGSSIEAILSTIDAPVNSATIEFGGTKPALKWLSTTPITFIYDPIAGILRTTIQRTTTALYSVDLPVNNLGPLNYIKITVANRASGSTVAFNNVTVDGITIGNFTGLTGEMDLYKTSWNVMGLTFTDGFTLQGTIALTGSHPGQDTNMVEITIGHYDVLGPLTSNVVIAPSPVFLNGLANLTATVDDTDYYGSDIDYAKYNLDAGSWSDWVLMSASDGAYDEVVEFVTADFTATAPVGTHTACVRGTDNFYIANTGDETCQDFIVTYVYDGFYEPVTNDLINLTKAGQAVPIKWRLTDALGAPIENPASFVGLFSSLVACDEFTDPVGAIEEVASGDSGLQYLGDGYWQFNWKTPKTYASSCRAMYVKFDSETTSDVVMFQFK